MKKFLLSLALVAFAASASMAQTANVSAPQVKKECCKDHKDGQKCDKPADQQCPDCKEKAAKQCDKAAMKHECKEAKGMKHECKEGAAKQCDKAAMKDCKKAEGMKHECKEGAAKQCDKAAMKDCKKAEGMKHECKEGAAKQCDKAAMKDCKKAEGMKHECKEGAAKQCDKAAMKKMHQECKDHKDGQKCDKPADQQCPDCKEKAKKN